MTYIGVTPTTGDFKKLDSISTSATATFNLRQGGVAVYPQSANHCIVSLNGVIQAPIDAFTIVNDTIVFASSLASSDVINFILVLGNVNDIGTPSDDTVSTAKIQNLAVSQAKIGDQAINEAKMQISNAPTNGYMLTAQSGNTGGMTWAEAPSGGLVLTSSGTTSGSANTITLTSAFSSTYQTYLLIINRLQTPTDDQIYFQYGVGGTADTSSECVWTMLGLGNDGSELRQYSHQTSGGYTNFMRIGKNVDADSDVGLSCALWLHNPNTTNPMKMYHGTVAQPYNTATNIAVFSVSGAKNDTTQFDSIRIGTENGYTIRSGGTVRIYGVVNA